jgi:L-lactate permease
LALGTPWTIITFLIGLVISTIIIFIVTRLFGERESVKIAFITAVIGAVIYTVIYYLLGNGLVAAIVGGIVWLISLKWLYKMGWLKSTLVAVIIWIIASIVGVLLPTASGPL